MARRIQHFSNHLQPMFVSAGFLREGDVEVELMEGGVAVVRLNKGKVNTFDTAMGNDLNEALDMCRTNDRVTSVVFTSKNPKVLSGGIDLGVVYEPEENEFKELWRTFESATKNMYTMNKPVVAAVCGFVL